jgi:hypothetical protein
VLVLAQPPAQRWVTVRRRDLIKRGELLASRELCPTHGKRLRMRADLLAAAGRMWRGLKRHHAATKSLKKALDLEYRLQARTALRGHHSSEVQRCGADRSGAAPRRWASSPRARRRRTSTSARRCRRQRTTARPWSTPSPPSTPSSSRSPHARLSLSRARPPSSAHRTAVAVGPFRSRPARALSFSLCSRSTAAAACRVAGARRHCAIAARVTRAAPQLALDIRTAPSVDEIAHAVAQHQVSDDI